MVVVICNEILMIVGSDYGTKSVILDGGKQMQYVVDFQLGLN